MDDGSSTILATTRSVAVIAVTGHALDEDRERAREAGCDVYLIKPVDLDQLLELLAGHAREPRSEAAGGG
ncbi:MAG TPA: hypothetical protein VMT16_00725 [Thermoanaerobaculia bacterium]|nr:hypothetical protein [Thermoanaerobaculia bacterium]